MLKTKYILNKNKFSLKFLLSVIFIFVFTLNSNVQGRTFSYATPTTINPNDTVRIQDPVQARLAVGFTGNNGIWIRVSSRTVHLRNVPYDSCWIRFSHLLLL